MTNKVPFNQLRYGTRFKYKEEDKQVFVRLGHDLVADWDGTLHAVACNRQGLYCFKDDNTALDTPVYVVENTEPVPPAGVEACCEVSDEKYNRVRFYRQTGDTTKPYHAPGEKLYDQACVTRLQAKVTEQALCAASEARRALRAESELTKARELLEIGHISNTPGWREAVAAYISNQSVPAAKCSICQGRGTVDDGEITCSTGGIPFENGPIKCVKDCPACSEQPAPVAVAQGLTWKAQGDANFYVLLKDGNWFAAIHMNGEMLVSQHEAFLNGICPQHGAVEDGKARDV